METLEDVDEIKFGFDICPVTFSISICAVELLCDALNNNDTVETNSETLFASLRLFGKPSAAKNSEFEARNRCMSGGKVAQKVTVLTTDDDNRD